MSTPEWFYRVREHHGYVAELTTCLGHAEHVYEGCVRHGFPGHVWYLESGNAERGWIELASTAYDPARKPEVKATVEQVRAHLAQLDTEVSA